MNHLTKKIVVSGMRTTGKIHLGNYHGALVNWLQLQDNQDFRTFFFAADYHALTTDYQDPKLLAQNSLDMIIDWLAAGLDPNKSIIFLQSKVPGHSELHLLLSMLTPLGWLERVPTYKDQLKKLSDKDVHTYGFLGYPVLQAADVLLYGADLVPIGEDQLSHLELVREICRRFNYLYGANLLKEPQPLLTKFSKVPGLDGQKMSKSYGNTIGISEDPVSIATKIKVMPTDPARVKRTDPGDPEKCPVWGLHKIYSDDETLKWVYHGCTTAEIGCVQCKKKLTENIVTVHEPIREKSLYYAKNLDIVKDILTDGAKKANEVASSNLDLCKSKMGLLGI